MTAQTPTLPAEFDCIEITTPGAPDVLKPARRPMPVPASGEVLIQVHAAGVNRPDVLQRIGRYPVPPGASDLPGLEVAGVVAAVAADGVGVAGGIQPVARPAFAVVRAGEEAINDRFPSIRRLVRQKRIDLRRTWR